MYPALQQTTGEKCGLETAWLPQQPAARRNRCSHFRSRSATDHTLQLAGTSLVQGNLGQPSFSGSVASATLVVFSDASAVSSPKSTVQTRNVPPVNQQPLPPEATKCCFVRNTVNGAQNSLQVFQAASDQGAPDRLRTPGLISAKTKPSRSTVLPGTMAIGLSNIGPA